MKTILLILALHGVAAAECFNQFTMCNTPMDYYVTENLMRLSNQVKEEKLDEFFRNLRCWDEGDESKGLITCEADGVTIPYEYKRQDDYKPGALLIMVPAEDAISLKVQN